MPPPGLEAGEPQSDLEATKRAVKFLGRVVDLMGSGFVLTRPDQPSAPQPEAPAAAG
jgi:hypothetical protein